MAECVVGHDPAGAAADLLGAVGPLVEVVALAPLPGPVRIVDRHPDHGDRRVHAGERPYARDAATGADDDPPIDLLTQDRVGAPDVAGPFGGDGGRLDAKTEPTERFGGVEDALVAGMPALLEGEVEIPGFDLQTEHAWIQDAQRLAEQLLAGLVAVQDGDCGGGHRSNHMARSATIPDTRSKPSESSATIDSA